MPPPPDTPPDKKAPRTDDPEQPDTSVEGNLGLLHHIVGRHYTRSHPDYDDALQEGAIALQRAQSTFDSVKGKWSTYAGRCVENAVRDFYRRERNRNQSTEPLDLRALQVSDPAPNPEELLERQILRHLVEKLPEIQRRVVSLKYGFEEIPRAYWCRGLPTWDQVAKQLHVSPSTAKRAHSEALRRLRAAYLV